jgi:hypothetical protein
MKELIKLASEGKINNRASIRDSQAIIIQAPVKKVWDYLADTSNWPNTKNSFTTPVKPDNTFSYYRHGQTFKGTFHLCVESRELSWTAKTTGLKLIHCWHLEAPESNQTIVTSEESLQGIRTLTISHEKFHKSLIKWIENIRQETGE